MSSIVSSILNSILGLLWNMALDSTVAKLKDGDVTDAKICEHIVREMDDVKTKLDGLSRKDLLNSYRFLQEGIDLVNVSLGKLLQNTEPRTALVKRQEHCRVGLCLGS